MNLSRFVFLLKTFNEEIEFLTIYTFLLFFPEKTSFLYFLIFGLLIILFLTKRILTSNNFGISGFSIFLITFNIVLIITSFFSLYILNSLLFFFDIFLISFYFLFGYHESESDEKRITSVAYLLSAFSLFQLTIFLISGNRTFFFKNPIHTGIISGIAVLILLYNLIDNFSFPGIILLSISFCTLYISGSKAAFIGVIGFSALMLIIKSRKLLWIFLILITTTIFIPNPIKNMFERSIYKDPYSTNRIDIWNLSLKMFLKFPYTGVGPDNFPEVSQQFNFKQLKGPANYFKVPRAPHSDYLKIITENGIPGVTILIFFLAIIFKRISYGPFYDIRKFLLLYLLFQALLFNLIFKTAFLFLFLYLVRSMFPNNRKYLSNSISFKLLILTTLVFTITIGYIFPYLSEMILQKTVAESSVSSKLSLLEKSRRYNPLDTRPYYAEALVFLNIFKKSPKPEIFSLSLYHLNRTIEMNRYFLDAYLSKSDLFLSVLDHGIVYPGLKEEILSPLKKYEMYNPFNPFVALEKANIHLKFGDRKMAEDEALRSLYIEPDFISALYFLHRNFNYYPSEKKFRQKIKTILKKVKGLKMTKGEYLFSLYKLPGELREKEI